MTIRRSVRVAGAGLILCLLAAFWAPQASAYTDHLKRIFALDNANLGIDAVEVDDHRVDAGIAVLDSGVDYDNAGLNIAAAISCTGVKDPSKEQCDESRGAGQDTAESSWHGTLTARAAAGIDQVDSVVGLAPGARVYGVDEFDGNLKAIKETKVFLEWDLAPAIAATEWITDHADEIDVAVGSPARACTYAPELESVPPESRPAGVYCIDEDQVQEYQDAVKEMVDAGVVFVTVAAPYSKDVSNTSIHGAISDDAIIVSAMADADGLPGGKGKGNFCPKDDSPEIEEKDDVRWSLSGYGPSVAGVAPGCALSVAQPSVAGAAALLASVSHPESREDVEAIRAALFGDSDCAVNPPDVDANVGAANCEWTDNSGDGVKEPLLDVHDEEVFDPVTVPGSASPSADSDVNGDGRSDLVTLRADGVAVVHPGQADAKFGSGVTSFGGDPLDPAQYDGNGHYVVDVADVNGDRRADLVTLTDEGEVNVYAGEADGTFEEGGVTTDLGLTPALLGPGGVEPVAVADVSGGGQADLIAYDDESDDLMIYPGRFDATFGLGVVAQADVSSALHTKIAGHHFVDAADVTGDNRADLVSIYEGGLAVFPGRSPLVLNEDPVTFAAPVISHQGEIDPAMLDGSGDEPFGLGDSTGDGLADLVLLDDEGTSWLYPGSGSGVFGTVVKASPSKGVSSTFGAKESSELVGLLDVDGNGHADFVGVTGGGYVATIKGQSNGTFSGNAVSFDGKFKTTQHEQTASSNHELAIEKPAWRRRGCDALGCFPESDDVAVWYQGWSGFYLRKWDIGNPLHTYVPYGNAGSPALDLPVMGDWDGDGDDTVGVWRREGEWSTYRLRNSNTEGEPDIVTGWGRDDAPELDLPVVGDWDGDGDDTVGVWRREGEWATFHLRNNNVTGPVDHYVYWGGDEAPYNDLPVVGDWDGDGDDTVGVWRRSNNTFYLRNSHAEKCEGSCVITAQFGNSEAPYNDLPVVGDWDGDGDDTVGVWRREGTVARFLLRNSNTTGAVEQTIYWGGNEVPYPNDLPLVGNWGP